MPTDTDTHQVEYIAVALAERIDALVAPALPYGISKTFEYFTGTISLTIPTYQTLLFEIGAALVRQGFEHLIILNGNRPNGTANDAVARHLSMSSMPTIFKVSAVSYWEPAADKVHAIRKSVTGGMGHGCDSRRRSSWRPARTSSRWTASRAPSTGRSAGTWWRRPTRPALTPAVHDPEAGHAAIFGDPTKASAAAGTTYIATVVDVLEATFKNLQGSYQERKEVILPELQTD